MNIIIDPLELSGYDHHARTIMRDAHSFLRVLGMRVEEVLARVPQLTEVSLSLSTDNTQRTWPTYRFKLAVNIPFGVMTTDHHSAKGTDVSFQETINLRGEELDQEQMGRIIDQTIESIVNHIRDLLKANLACHEDAVRTLNSAIDSLEPSLVS